VKSGEQVITITPSDAGKIIGKLQLPMYGSGRVKKGQKVFIKFANYPHTHFGIIKGIVRQISLVPEQDYYFLEVSLPNGLKTNYNKELKFTYGMKGTAEIITEDLRLIEKLYEPLKSILRKNRE
jgi:HlyD family secretion protein